MYLTLTLSALALLWCARYQTTQGNIRSSLLLTSVTAPWLIALIECVVQESSILSLERPVSLWVMLSAQSRVDLLHTLSWFDSASLLSAALSIILITRSLQSSHHIEMSQPQRQPRLNIGWLLKSALFVAPIIHLICWKPRLSWDSLNVLSQVGGLFVMSALTWWWCSKKHSEERALEARLVALIWISLIVSVNFYNASQELLEISEALQSYPDVLMANHAQLRSFYWRVVASVFSVSLIMSLLISATGFVNNTRSQTSKGIEGALFVMLSLCAATIVSYQAQRFSQHRDTLEAVWRHAAPLTQTGVTLPRSSSTVNELPTSTLLLKTRSMWVDGRAVDKLKGDTESLLAHLQLTRAEQTEVMKKLTQSVDPDVSSWRTLDAQQLAFTIGASREIAFERVYGAMELARRVNYRDFRLMVRSPSGARRFIPAHLTGSQPDLPTPREMGDSKVWVIKPKIQLNITARGYELGEVLNESKTGCIPEEPDVRVDQVIPCRGGCDQPDDWDHQALRRALIELKERDQSEEWLNVNIQSELTWEAVVATLDVCREVTVVREDGVHPFFNIALSLARSRLNPPSLERLLTPPSSTP